MPRKQSSQRSPVRQRAGGAPSPRSDGQNVLRIIAGQWRGRKLRFPSVEGLRPTPDRVRETLFNWLQVDLPGSRCLDLFSGSGALGLEALSRGAAEATLIDRSGEVVAQLKENLRLLGAVNGVVIQRSALDWLEHSATMADRPYDLVFLDPPFHCNMLEPCCERLERQGYLADNAWIYIEAERSLEQLPIPAHWRVHRRKEAGQVAYCLCRREAPDPDAQR